MFVDKEFFGLARSGEIDGKIRYPIVLVSGSDEFRLIQDKIGKASHRPWNFMSSDSNFIEVDSEIIVVTDMVSLIQRPRRLVSFMMDLRKKYGFSRLIYAQGFGDPYLIPILTYLGISIFDDTTAQMEGMDGIQYTQFGRMKDGMDHADGNSRFVSQAAELCSTAVAKGTLREIVERANVSAKATELLRLSDTLMAGILEETFPRYTSKIMAHTLDSLNRPDLTRYRKYISEEYTSNSEDRIALFIPCTARKPYSSSKTHQRLIRALGNRRRHLHEIIVTSPVGLVPRELETTYPPGFYDIPVTGRWFLEEKEMISEMIRKFLNRNKYRKIIAFIDDSLNFIKDDLPEGSYTLQWHKGREDEEFLELLNLIDQNITSDTKPKRSGKIDEYASIASYQFGSWVREYVDSCRIVKNYDRDMLVYDGKPALVFHEERGLFSITKAAAEWFLRNGRFLVEIDDFKPTANIYAVGVKSASPEIRPGDEVVIHHSGEIRGVGTAKMPVSAMIDLKKGVAVKVRN